MRATTLESVLQDIGHSVEQLVCCLQNELKALNDKQYESLIMIAQEKQQLVERLDMLDNQRKQFDSSKNFSDYLIQQDRSGKLAGQWVSIRDTIKECQQQNIVNGRLLQRYHRLSQETINLLSGRTANTDTTYGPNGLKQGQHSLISDTQV